MVETYLAIKRSAVSVSSSSSSNNDNDEESKKRYSHSQSVVSLVSIRLQNQYASSSPAVVERAIQLTRLLVELSEKIKSSNKNNEINGNDDGNIQSSSFRVVCSSDWVPVALIAGAHGVHVKEAHLDQIPDIRTQFQARNSNTHTNNDDQNTNTDAAPAATAAIIGTSTHSVESAVASFQTYRPDYYFVGTCFQTASHPEKSMQDLEGPKLPGLVQQTLSRLLVESQSQSASASASAPLDSSSNTYDDNGDNNDAPASIAVLAIGGINESNCQEPMLHGANGVAVIRAVLRAEDPAETATKMRDAMMACFES